ncbi:MAG: YheU family protein [Pseudomonadales bacterium]|nr:YheU family protein [Pseudomonadales bacterium]
MSDNLIEVPWQELEESTLNNLIEEFVTRDGTDYGELELSMDQKVKQVVAGIKNKRYVIVFDVELEQCNIVDIEYWRSNCS